MGRARFGPLPVVLSNQQAGYYDFNSKHASGKSATARFGPLPVVLSNQRSCPMSHPPPHPILAILHSSLRTAPLPLPEPTRTFGVRYAASGATPRARPAPPSRKQADPSAVCFAPPLPGGGLPPSSNTIRRISDMCVGCARSHTGRSLTHTGGSWVHGMGGHAAHRQGCCSRQNQNSLKRLFLRDLLLFHFCTVEENGLLSAKVYPFVPFT